MMRLEERLLAYYREIAFSIKATPTCADRCALLGQTARFHAYNAFGIKRDNRSTFAISLRIDRRKLARVLLRPRAGDIFVLYEVLAFKTYHIAQTLIPPQEVRVILDCGANIGLTSLFFAARYPNAQIFAVEPDPSNFALLKANIARELRITPIQACVTGRPQHEVRFTTDNPAWGNRISSEEDGILVRATTITELCHQLKLNKVDLLKLDIEGAEQEVLQNGDFLAIVDHIIIEFHEGYGFGSFQEDIEPYGLRAKKASPPDTYMVTAHR